MNINGNEEDDDKPEEGKSVDKDGNATGLSVAEVHRSAVTRHLTYQPRHQHHKQHHRYQHWPPIRHFLY